eukprot:354267-Chlamydomonas_euryale.AAC.8
MTDPQSPVPERGAKRQRGDAAAGSSSDGAAAAAASVAAKGGGGVSGGCGGGGVSGSGSGNSRRLPPGLEADGGMLLEPWLLSSCTTSLVPRGGPSPGPINGCRVAARVSARWRAMA